MSILQNRTLYIDTSVIGGYFDAEFAVPTRRLWQLAKAGSYNLRTSEVTATEMSHAPAVVRNLFAKTFPELIRLTLEMLELADAYIGHQVVPKKFRDDALHVAACSIAGISPLVSWN